MEFTRLSEIKKVLAVGKKVTIISNITGAGGVIVGGKCTVVKTPTEGSNNLDTVVTLRRDYQPGGNTINMYIADIKVESTNINELQKEADNYNKKLAEIQEKMDYMRANNIEEYDEQEYAIFKMLDILEQPDLDRHSRAKVLKEMFQPM